MSKPRLLHEWTRRSIVLLESRVTSVACQTQVRGVFLELGLVFRSACVERILGGGLGFLVEERIFFPKARISESFTCGVARDTWRPCVGRGREEMREGHQHRSDRICVAHGPCRDRFAAPVIASISCMLSAMTTISVLRATIRSFGVAALWSWPHAAKLIPTMVAARQPLTA